MVAEFTPVASPERVQTGDKTRRVDMAFLSTPAPSPTPVTDSGSSNNTSPFSSPSSGVETTLSYARAAAMRLSNNSGSHSNTTASTSAPMAMAGADHISVERRNAADDGVRDAAVEDPRNLTLDGNPEDDNRDRLVEEEEQQHEGDLLTSSTRQTTADSIAPPSSSMLRTVQSARHFGEPSPAHSRRYSMPSRFGGFNPLSTPSSTPTNTSSAVGMGASSIVIQQQQHQPHQNSLKQHGQHLAHLLPDISEDVFSQPSSGAKGGEQTISRRPSWAFENFEPLTANSSNSSNSTAMSSSASFDGFKKACTSTAGHPISSGGTDAMEPPSRDSYEKYLANAMAAPTANSLTCYLIQFTSGRTDTFYIPNEIQFPVNIGDYVVVEADRGEDLGRVIMDNIKVPLPRRNSTSSLSGQRDSPTFEMEEAMAMGSGCMQPPPQSASNFPKKIYRLAQPVEIESLLSKIRDEINAIAVGQYKVQEWKLPMAIIDAEYQWDRRKLTFFFSVTLPQFYPNQPSPRIDFRTLVRDLYQIYRTRIWMYCVDKDKNRTNRSHNREKFLKQLYKDSLTLSTMPSQGMPQHVSSTATLAPIGSGMRSLSGGQSFQQASGGSMLAHPQVGVKPGSSDDFGDEWDINDVLSSLHRESTVDVEDLAYGMTGMHLQQQHHHHHHSANDHLARGGTKSSIPLNQHHHQSATFGYYDDDLAFSSFAGGGSGRKQPQHARTAVAAADMNPVKSIWGKSSGRQSADYIAPGGTHDSNRFDPARQLNQHGQQQRFGLGGGYGGGGGGSIHGGL